MVVVELGLEQNVQPENVAGKIFLKKVHLAGVEPQHCIVIYRDVKQRILKEPVVLDVDLFLEPIVEVKSVAGILLLIQFVRLVW